MDGMAIAMLQQMEGRITTAHCRTNGGLYNILLNVTTAAARIDLLYHTSTISSDIAGDIVPDGRDLVYIWQTHKAWELRGR